MASRNELAAEMKLLPQTRTAKAISLVAFFLTSVSFAQLEAEDSGSNRRPSVLFLNIDDWNDWNEVLQGHSQAITPNIKRLAELGVVFSNSICSSPTCFPSRSAVFTGIHPARSGNIVNDNSIHPWRFYAPDAVTLPRQLSAQGWKSIGIAKNFHNGERKEFDEYISRKGGRLKQVQGSGINLNPSGVWGILIGNCFYKGKIKAACGPGLDGVQISQLQP